MHGAILFAGMLVCACANRFLFMPKLPRSSRRLGQSVLIELGLGLSIID